MSVCWMFVSGRRRHTICGRDWSSDVCSSDLTPATITVDALPGRTFRGSVTFIYPQLDEKTRTLTARVAVENADGALRPGMYATAALATAGRRGVSLPLQAVLPPRAKENVFLKRGDGRVVPPGGPVGVPGGSLVVVVEGG